MFDGRTIAVVGNAPTTHAERIDACDLAIRFNRYRLGTSGQRITHHACNASEIARRNRDVPCIGCVPMDRTERVDWNDVAGVTWLPMIWLHALAGKLPARPSAGCMVTHWLLDTFRVERLVLAGFSWRGLLVGLHDLEAERRLLDARCDRRVEVLT